MSTTESTLSMTEPEIEIEPFVIDLDSPYSTPPSSPTVSYNELEPSPDYVLDEPPDCTLPDFLSDTDGESLLDFLYSPTPPSLGLYETLLADPSPASRAAILYYLTLAPILQHNISTLVPPLLDDPRVMVSIATNIGFFNALGYTSESELEYLLMAILTCKNPDKKKSNSKNTNEAIRYINDPDPRILNLYHMTHTQIRLHRTALVPKHILRIQHQHQRSRKYHKKLHTKWWQRTAEIACLSLSPSDHLRSSVPLPYGCATNAQLFADVNEMYTLETPPCKDWAQTRGVCPVYYTIPDGLAPRVKLPGRGKDKRKLPEPDSGSEVTIQEELMFSVSRVWAEELFACEERREGLRVKTPGC